MVLDKTTHYVTGPRKGQLKFLALKKLIKEHQKASQIDIRKLTYEQVLDKLKNNGFVLDHKKSRLSLSTRLGKSKKVLLIKDKPPTSREQLARSQPAGRGSQRGREGAVFTGAQARATTQAAEAAAEERRRRRLAARRRALVSGGFTRGASQPVFLEDEI
tara:strand:+ start:1412 stop:1891 length:480 start_codon:yes stop_codon:yes gene_type:complete